MRTPVTALLAASFLTTVAWARPPADASVVGAEPSEDQARRPPPLDEILADHALELGIDATTLDELLAIIDAHADELDALHEQARTAREQVEASGDVAAAQDAHRAVMDAQKAVMDEIMGALDEGQRQALRDLLPPPPRPGDMRGGQPGDGCDQHGADE